jgi:hypothetical protein
MWAFAIPKNALKGSLIFHLVELNSKLPKPQTFRLPSVESLASLMVHNYGKKEHPWACHVDLSNAYWSMVLPEGFQESFRFRLEGTNYSLLRLPFGWKASPVLCQRILEYFLLGLDVGEVLVLLYIDDFMVVGLDKDRVRGVTMNWVQVLESKGFKVSPKSILEPTGLLKFLGKKVDLVGGGLLNLEGGLQQGLVRWLGLAVGKCTRLSLDRCMGKLRWLARPHMASAPFVAGAFAHSLWGPSSMSRTPVSVLRGLACLLGLGVLGWSVPKQVPQEWSWDRVVFADSARQGPDQVWGLFSQGFGSRLGDCDFAKTQQSGELEGLEAAIRVASSRGLLNLILVGDNVPSILQLVNLKASIGLTSQQRILRRVIYRVFSMRMTVWLFWCPGVLMPADPISRCKVEYGGDKVAAVAEANRRLVLVKEGGVLEFMGKLGRY